LPGRDLVELAVWPGPPAHPGRAPEESDGAEVTATLPSLCCTTEPTASSSETTACHSMLWLTDAGRASAACCGEALGFELNWQMVSRDKTLKMKGVPGIISP
jgi:hypothetical protein